MDNNHRALMDRTYRRMKYIYDATRPFFLAGRAALRREVAVLRPAHVLEVGCGTGRNLILMARTLRGTQFTGLDISSEMVAYAQGKVRQAKLEQNITLLEQELADFSAMPNAALPDVIIFSYSLSMIPNWQEVLSQAAAMVLTNGGHIVIVDFSNMTGWPSWFGQRLRKNLSYFHVFPRTELADYLQTEEQFQTWKIQTRNLYGGYAAITKLQSPRH